MLRIRDVYLGSEFFPSRIRIKELKYFNPKKSFWAPRKWDPGCSSRIRVLIFFTHPGSRGQKGTGSGSTTLLRWFMGKLIRSLYRYFVPYLLRIRFFVSYPSLSALLMFDVGFFRTINRSSEKEKKVSVNLRGCGTALYYIEQVCGSGWCGSGMFIPEPWSEFFHPGSRDNKIPDPQQRIYVL